MSAAQFLTAALVLTAALAATAPSRSGATLPLAIPLAMEGNECPDW